MENTIWKGQITKDLSEVCHIFKDYYYQPIIDVDMYNAVENVMTLKRMVFIAPIFINSLKVHKEENEFCIKHLNFDLNQLENDSIFIFFRHDNSLIFLLTTNADIFRDYIFKCKLESECGVCFENDSDGANDSYKCSRCNKAICINCYKLIKNMYCSRCVYCKYSLLEHIYKQRKNSHNERIFAIKNP